MYVFLGWLNVALLIFNTLLSITRRIYKNWKKDTSFWKGFGSFVGFLRKGHPVSGSVLLVTSFLHGYLALGVVMLHTGYILWYAIIAQFLVYVLGFRARLFPRKWLNIHRSIMVLIWFLFFLHYLRPWII